MDNKELLLIADVVSKEKNISQETVLNALAEGMETALKKDFPEGSQISVTIDASTGEVTAYRAFEIVEQIENPEGQMLRSEIEDEIVEDGYVYEVFTPVFNRQKSNITKQVALQKIKQGSRDTHIEQLLSQPIAVFNGVVKVVRKDQIIADCKGLDISIPRRNLLPRDNYKNGDTIFFALEKDKNQYVGTRTSETYLNEVFKREIVQVEEGDIELVSIARHPGFRSKILVRSNIRGLDPVKTCIGSRGAHIKNIQSMLGGEFIDLIAYSENKADMIVKAFEPVVVTNIIIDEENNVIEVAVSESDISKAIGKSGKNIEIISKVLQSEVKVFSEGQWNDKNSLSDEVTIATFMQGINCDRELAIILLENGFSSLEEIAYLPRQEFLVEELDDETIDAIREAARDTLNSPAELMRSNGIGQLVSLGFSGDQLTRLQDNHVFGLSEVADLATFELQELIPELEETDAQAVIVKARSQDSRFTELAA